MGLESQEKNRQERIDDCIITFQLQRIVYNGMDGYFMPYSGFKQLNIVVNDYITYQNLLIKKDERIAKLDKLEMINFKLKTALGITVAFDVGTSLIAVGMGIMCYNLALYNN